MQSPNQVTAFDPESPEFKAFRQSAISRRHSDLRSADARNPQKHESPNQNSNQNKQLYIYAMHLLYIYMYYIQHPTELGKKTFQFTGAACL